MPFKLQNAAKTFQRLIDKVFRGLPFLYANSDISITSRDIKEHNTLLEQAFQRLLYFGLKINVHKCYFSEFKLHFPSHKIDQEGISSLLNKIEVIQNFLQPTPL